MLKLGIFIYNDWAFGSLHNGLIKELFKNGIYANIIDWRNSYSEENFYHMSETFDFILTPYGESVYHLINHYKYPPEKIVSVIHANSEIYQGQQFSVDPKLLHSVGVVNPILIDLMKSFGHDIDYKFTPNGIHVNYFKNDISQSLKSIGYAGRIETITYNGFDCKRGYLVKHISEIKNLPFFNIPEIHFSAMPSFYKRFDCLIVSSNEDACALPFMEAAAAGRMVIGTNVGALMMSDGNGGCIVPTEENDFVNSCCSLIDYFISNPIEYRKRCIEIQNYAQNNYDWSHLIHNWINLF